MLAVEVKRCLCSWSDTRVKNIADPVTQVRFRQLRVRVNFLSCPGLYKQLPQWRSGGRSVPEQGWKYAGIELQLLNCGDDEDAVIVSRTKKMMITNRKAN